jgi:hypothetical protein
MNDRPVQVLLDGSAVVAFTRGSVHVGEVIAEGDDGQATVGLPGCAWSRRSARALIRTGSICWSTTGDRRHEREDLAFRIRRVDAPTVRTPVGGGIVDDVDRRGRELSLIIAGAQPRCWRGVMRRVAGAGWLRG